ncbi:TonB family protein [Stutzerimonas stutzeri]|uniref:energy transducer TonB n=1 Tax=Stutzerimonas sp. S1 TaxID=3030652 RepID=UPI002224D0FE|nr:energy transducer TonB [Stutzerimonas sp. S1]MCW3148003.1 TonB family protein [Stutzerimonas sp. S1]
MTGISMPMSMQRAHWPSRGRRRHALALSVAIGLHVLVLAALLGHWQVVPPVEPQVRTLSTRLISLPPPAVAVAERIRPVAETVPEPVEPSPRVESPEPEVAALARKRVEPRQNEVRRVAELQRAARLKRERQLAAEAQARAEEQRQQAVAAEQAAAAAKARAAAEALAAASRPYLPISKQAPDYPDRALDKGIEGDCTVTYGVTPDGRVENPQVLGDCHPLFVRPSLAAARTFRYRPRIVDGRAVRVPNVKNTFHYRIE